MPAKNPQGFVDGHFQHVGNDGFAVDLHFQDDAAEAFPIAIGAAEIHVAEELHLDVLEAVATAGRTSAFAGIEAESAGGVTAFLGERGRGEQFSNGVECPDVTGGVRAGGATDGGLIDHHHVFELFVADDGTVVAGGWSGLCFSLLKAL